MVVYFEGESGSGMQAELMVPDRSRSCRRAGRSPTQSSMAVSSSVLVLLLPLQHHFHVTISSPPIGLRPHLVWRLGSWVSYWFTVDTGEHLARHFHCFFSFRRRQDAFRFCLAGVVSLLCSASIPVLVKGHLIQHW